MLYNYSKLISKIILFPEINLKQCNKEDRKTSIWTRFVIFTHKRSTTDLDVNAAAANLLQSCPTLCNPIDTRLLCPWDSPGKNTGVGCHFLLQCMKVKSEREVPQLCPILRDPMDCSLPGSSVHGLFQERVLEWVAIASSIGLAYTYEISWCLICAAKQL